MDTVIARGDGVGIEVCGRFIRGVVLRSDLANRLAVVKEVTALGEGPERTFDALARLRAELGATEAPTRVAWFSTGSALQRVEASALGGHELEELRQRLARDHGINSTMLLDTPDVRWMMTVRWRTDQAWELQELAESAGFVDVEVEPAPVALCRVLPPETTAALRVTDTDESWIVLVDDAVPVAAAHLEVAREAGPTDDRVPRLSATAGRCSTDGLVDVVGVDALSDAVAHAVDRNIDLDRQPVPALHLANQSYPHVPHHDLRSPERCAVALGAAVGAAGLAGRAQPVDVVGRRPERVSDLPRPWAIEEVRETGDAVARDDGPERSGERPSRRPSRWRRSGRRHG